MRHEGGSGFAVWITGLPASGKSTVGRALAAELQKRDVAATVLESDALRAMLSSPQYDERDRDYFYASMALIGRVLTGHGLNVIFDATANLRSYRERARREIPRFVEVYVECPVEVCIARDPKGIYAMAQRGEAQHVPGVQATYEPPLHPDVVVRGDTENPEDAAQRVIDVLERRGFIPPQK